VHADGRVSRREEEPWRQGPARVGGQFTRLLREIQRFRIDVQLFEQEWHADISSEIDNQTVVATSSVTTSFCFHEKKKMENRKETESRIVNYKT
jgi:hypothetical protein